MILLIGCLVLCHAWIAFAKNLVLKVLLKNTTLVATFAFYVPILMKQENTYNLHLQVLDFIKDLKFFWLDSE